MIVKRSVDELFMHYFQNIGRLRGASSQTPSGLRYVPRWGMEAADPTNCPPLEKSCGRPCMGNETLQLTRFQFRLQQTFFYGFCNCFASQSPPSLAGRCASDNSHNIYRARKDRSDGLVSCQLANGRSMMYTTSLWVVNNNSNDDNSI